MLISLMLIFALMAIALLAVLPSVKQQMQRDREEELRHRGTMYMRAIQHFYKKVGRYPTSVEELENSNHVRYLRKRYKDPMSWDPQTHKERDFKFLHMQDVMLNNGPVLGAPPGGAPGLGALPGLGGSPKGGPQGPGGLPGALGQMQQLGGAVQALGGAQPPGSTDTSGSSNPGDAQGNSGSDSSGSSNPNNPTPNSGPGNGPSGSGTGGPGPKGQVFGGGAIVGVASTNKKDKAIHEFNKKSHYTDWYFIYDPSMDRGGLLIGPWQPITIGGGGLGQPIPGAPGTGLPTGGLGQGLPQAGQSGFGQPPNPNPQNQQIQQNPGENPPDN